MSNTLQKIADELQELEKRRNALKSMMQAAKADARVSVDKMTKTERIRATWELPELSSSLMDVLEDNGFKTGSTVYGNAEDATDVDWCIMIPPEIFDGYALNTNDPGYWEADGFSSIYAHHRGKLLNILCFSNGNLCRAWWGATRVMEKMVGLTIPGMYQSQSDYYALESTKDSKWRRVRIFRALRDVMFEVRPKGDPCSIKEAKEHHKCRICKREAINFTRMSERKKWENSGICERCREAGFTIVKDEVVHPEKSK